jgi:hypothetical protein
MQNMNLQKRGRCTVRDGEAGCNPETVGRIYMHYAAHELRRAQALLFFLNPYISNGLQKLSRL